MARPQPPGPSRRTVSNRGVDLAVFEHGDPSGTTVVLVHGWPDTHRLWHRVVPLLVAEGLHAVTYDTCGMGETTRPQDDLRFRLPELASDLLSVVDAVSPEAPVHLVGHDWGSVQGWEAVCEPAAAERIASFTSISGPNIDHLAQWLRRNLTRPSLRGVGSVLAQAASSTYVWFFISPAAPPVFRRIASRQRWARLLHRTEGVHPDPANHSETLVDDMVCGLAYYRANVTGSLRRPRERRTQVPVLQLVPTEDPAIRAASYDDTPRWVDAVERIDVPYGHWIPLTGPEVVAAETVRFIGQVATRPSS